MTWATACSAPCSTRSRSRVGSRPSCWPVSASRSWSWSSRSRALCSGRTAQVDPALGLERWDAVADGLHNSNTDLICVARRVPARARRASVPLRVAATRGCVVRRSRDGRRLDARSRASRCPGKDIRDPKLAVIGGRLHLYALPNAGVAATPEGTMLATSADGVQLDRARADRARRLALLAAEVERRREDLVRARVLEGARQVDPAALDRRHALGAGVGDPGRQRQRRDRHRVPARRPAARDDAPRGHARHGARQLRRPHRHPRRRAALHRDGRRTRAA